MLHRALPGAVALLGLLAGPLALADDRYSSGPQVRLGIDILWGGAGFVHVAPPPVVVFQPPRHHHDHRHDHRRGYQRGYERGYDRGYNRANWRDKGHRRHRHRGDDDCDD